MTGCRFYANGTTALILAATLCDNHTIYLPDYLCMEILGAFRYSNVKFYHVDDNLKPTFDDIYHSIVVIIDYFGVEHVQDDDFQKLKDNGNEIILDMTHSILDITRFRKDMYQIASLRKIFQVPDCGVIKNSPCTLEECDIRYHNIYDSINVKEIIEKRWENLRYLYDKLKDTNLCMYDIKDIKSPFMLPLLFDTQYERDNMKKWLIDNMIYPPIHWECGHPISKRILSIPIDQRYDIEDMERIYEVLSSGLSAFQLWSYPPS